MYFDVLYRTVHMYVMLICMTISKEPIACKNLRENFTKYVRDANDESILTGSVESFFEVSFTFATPGAHAHRNGGNTACRLLFIHQDASFFPEEMMNILPGGGSETPNTHLLAVVCCSGCLDCTFLSILFIFFFSCVAANSKLLGMMPSWLEILDRNTDIFTLLRVDGRVNRTNQEKKEGCQFGTERFHFFF